MSMPEISERLWTTPSDAMYHVVDCVSSSQMIRLNRMPAMKHSAVSTVNIVTWVREADTTFLAAVCV